jgi:hypothetical protein
MAGWLRARSSSVEFCKPTFCKSKSVDRSAPIGTSGESGPWFRRLYRDQVMLITYSGTTNCPYFVVWRLGFEHQKYQ